MASAVRIHPAEYKSPETTSDAARMNNALTPETAVNTHFKNAFDSGRSDARSGRGSPAHVAPSGRADGGSARSGQPGPPLPSAATPPSRPGVVPSPVTTLAVREQSYIPVALAKKTIDAMQQDMALTRERHLKAITDISGHYERIEEDTKAYFLKFITQLRDQARSEIASYRLTSKSMHLELSELRTKSSETISNLEARVHALEEELASTLTKYHNDVSTGTAKQEELVSTLTQQFEQQLAEANAATTSVKTKAKARMIQVEDKFGGLVQARDDTIAFLEMDRRRLVSATRELHTTRDALAAALQSVENETTVQITDLTARVAQLESTNAAQASSISILSTGKAASDARVDALDNELSDRNAQLAAMAPALAASNEALVSLKSALNPSLVGKSGDAPTPAALAAAQAEIATLRSKLLLQVPAGASSGGSVGDGKQMAAAVAERVALQAQLDASSSANAALQQEVVRQRGAAAEAGLVHKIELAEANNKIEELEDAMEAQAKASAAHTPRGGDATVRAAEAAAAAESYQKLVVELVSHAQESVKQGEAMWVDKKKRQALKLYEAEVEAALRSLPPGSALTAFLKAAIDEANERNAENQPAKAAFVLKQTLERLIVDGAAEVAQLQATAAALVTAAAAPSRKGASRPAMAGSGSVEEDEVASLRTQLEKLRVEQAATAAPVVRSGSPGFGATRHASGGTHISSAHVGEGAVSSSTAALVAALARAEAAESQLRAQESELESLRAEVSATPSNSNSKEQDEGDEGEGEGGEGSGNTSGGEEGEAGLGATATPREPGAGPTVATGKVGAGAGTASGGSSAPGKGAAVSVKDATKLKEQDKLIKDLRTKIRTLEAAVSKASTAPKAGAGTPAVDEKAMAAALEKRQAMLEKKWKKEREDLEKDLGREIDIVTKKLSKVQGELSEQGAAVAALTAERDALKRKAAGLVELEKELESLRVQAEEAKRLKVELDAMTAKAAELEKLYKDEQILRKRYYNIIEDMKGKIRVYCRTRPMSTSELDRGNYSVVSFPDEVTIELDTGRGKKQFVYDQCYGPASTQEEVFEDTENLIQSAFDGYNVSMFAYGQTGSGKTHTMVGNRELPGVTPRAVRKIFALIDSNKATYDCTVQAYMVELYLDNLIDLFWKSENPRERSEGPKLEIKKDDKGLVVIKGVSIKDCANADAVLELFDAGNGARHVGSTAMNATSSRSHLVFALLINTYNRATKKTTTGKLSLIDLAGSERVGKTGASAERLKEAQSINKSLSALGNVISALSTNATFVPYRDNKLTQLMSDSLGGNAKTLMFVNMSPADYNAEETQSSLVYAARVKLITNSAEKMQETQEIARLKKIILGLKTGSLAPDAIIDLDVADAGLSTPAAASGSDGADGEPTHGDGDYDGEAGAGAGASEGKD